MEPEQLSKKLRPDLDDLPGGSRRWKRLDDHPSSMDGLELGKLRGESTHDNRGLGEGAVTVEEP